MEVILCLFLLLSAVITVDCDSESSFYSNPESSYGSGDGTESLSAEDAIPPTHYVDLSSSLLDTMMDPSPIMETITSFTSPSSSTIIISTSLRPATSSSYSSAVLTSTPAPSLSSRIPPSSSQSSVTLVFNTPLLSSSISQSMDTIVESYKTSTFSLTPSPSSLVISSTSTSEHSSSQQTIISLSTYTVSPSSTMTSIEMPISSSLIVTPQPSELSSTSSHTAISPSAPSLTSLSSSPTTSSAEYSTTVVSSSLESTENTITILSTPEIFTTYSVSTTLLTSSDVIVTSLIISSFSPSVSELSSTSSHTAISPSAPSLTSLSSSPTTSSAEYSTTVVSSSLESTENTITILSTPEIFTTYSVSTTLLTSSDVIVTSLIISSFSPSVSTVLPTTTTTRAILPSSTVILPTSTTVESSSHLTKYTISSAPPSTSPSDSPSPTSTPREEEEEEEEERGGISQFMLYLLSGLGGSVLVLMIAVACVCACVCRKYRSLRIIRSQKKVLKFSDNIEMVPVQRTRSQEVTSNSHRPTPSTSAVARQPQTYEDLFSHIQSENLPIIAIGELESYVEALEEDQALDEYLEVLEMDTQPYYLTARLKCNRSKNRYVDILANELTRVHLLNPAGHTRYSDYINANYIEGYKKKKEYIAAQGPLEKTAADFWSMVWTENSANIVMVTNLVEDERHKCFKYWPSEGVLLAHSLSIVLQTEKTMSYYTIRTFKITLNDDRYDDSGESRLVTQYHFTAWPDHGVPDDTDSMLDFVSRVRSSVTPSHGPIVVHCSAGVGRTGTFIAVDVMLQKLERGESLDIMNWVCRMRAQRSSMVQTSWQYMFIYKTLTRAAGIREANSGITREEEGEDEEESIGDSSSKGQEEGQEGEEEGGGGVSNNDDKGESDDEGRLMSLPSFSSSDFMDMHIV